MTPKTYHEIIEAEQERLDRHYEIQAHFTACMMSMWSKKNIRGADLWRSSKKEETIHDFEERQQEFMRNCVLLDSTPISQREGN